jgi:hypothetical protein
VLVVDSGSEVVVVLEVLVVIVVATVDVVAAGSEVHAAATSAHASTTPAPRMCPTLLTDPPLSLRRLLTGDSVI